MAEFFENLVRLWITAFCAMIGMTLGLIPTLGLMMFAGPHWWTMMPILLSGMIGILVGSRQ